MWCVLLIGYVDDEEAPRDKEILLLAYCLAAQFHSASINAYKRTFSSSLCPSLRRRINRSRTCYWFNILLCSHMSR